MKEFSNKYIYGFISLLIIVVAILLSLIYLILKPLQDRNIRIEQMKNILASVNIYIEPKESVESVFNRYIIKKYVVDYYGNVLEQENPESINLKNEVSKLNKIELLISKKSLTIKSKANILFERIFGEKKIDTLKINKQINALQNSLRLPVYECLKDSIKYTIFALYGKGLWGPIWGYISLYPDYNTVYGAYFDHKSETPGLGAEINTLKFQKQFSGKYILKEDKLVSLKVSKTYNKESKYEVEAISGGTITSKGVEKMLLDCLNGYYNFIKKQKTIEKR